MKNPTPKAKKRILIISTAIGRSHLTRLALIALKLKCQEAEVAFGFKENSQILEHYQFQVFPVADAVVTDFSSNVFAAYPPSLIEQCVKDELTVIETFKPDAIVGDFRFTAALSSKVSEIPYITSARTGYGTESTDWRICQWCHAKSA